MVSPGNPLQMVDFPHLWIYFQWTKNYCLVPFVGAFSPWPHRVARHISHSSCPSVRSLWGIHISWGQDRWFLHQKFSLMAMYNIEIESGIMGCIIIHNYLCMSKNGQPSRENYTIAAYIYVYIYIHVRVYICIYICVYLYMYIYMCTCTYICIYVYMYVYIYVNKYIYMCRYINIYMGVLLDHPFQ